MRAVETKVWSQNQRTSGGQAARYNRTTCNESGQDCLQPAPCTRTMQDSDKAMRLEGGQAEERLGWYGIMGADAQGDLCSGPIDLGTDVKDGAHLGLGRE
ncbi:hypothetical protein J1614_007050 [Plenodomus biglobosus]|nr:hypothetical protein J1614_007050 [Plenodomus biglobosus]